MKLEAIISKVGFALPREEADWGESVHIRGLGHVKNNKKVARVHSADGLFLRSPDDNVKNISKSSERRLKSFFWLGQSRPLFVYFRLFLKMQVKYKLIKA